MIAAVVPVVVVVVVVIVVVLGKSVVSVGILCCVLS